MTRLHHNDQLSGSFFSLDGGEGVRQVSVFQLLFQTVIFVSLLVPQIIPQTRRSKLIRAGRIGAIYGALELRRPMVASLQNLGDHAPATPK